MMPDEFETQLVAMLPKLRVQALALTRNGAAANDLVQETVKNALSARGSFQMGTNLSAWLHRILKNQFITELRRKRPSCGIDDAPETSFAVRAGHEDGLLLKELSRVLGRLSPDHREALVMVVVHDMSYEQIAEATGCAIGTAKSRVHRARLLLRSWLMGDDTRLSDPCEADDVRRAPGGARTPGTPGRVGTGSSRPPGPA